MAKRHGLDLDLDDSFEENLMDTMESYDIGDSKAWNDQFDNTGTLIKRGAKRRLAKLRVRCSLDMLPRNIGMRR